MPKKPYPLLDRISSPADLKALDAGDLPVLAEEIRSRIIDVVLKNGGHLASNLGVVELTIALHRIFNSPEDQIIWDVGHQCYTHKLLTGRNKTFDQLRMSDGLSGFPKKNESGHDIFETGHSSTSISASLGVLTGKRIQGNKGKVIAVIGDGALTGGMAFEGLNHAGHLAKDLIIIFNDNNMSISPNVGGLSSNSNLSKLSTHVSRLTATPLYQKIRDNIDRGLKGIPVLGYILYVLTMRFKRGMKALFLKETIFSELGFEYVGPIDGHSISQLTQVLDDVKEFQRPVVVHVLTQKGKGYSLAEGDPTMYHGVSPFCGIDGKLEDKSPLSFTEIFSSALVSEAERNDHIVAITAAMAEGTGLSCFKRMFPGRFFDVGITEQHAITFAGGLASSGMKPVVAIYSTFIQRAVDQVIHDVALQNIPVVIALDRAGLVGGDGETHQGIHDIALFRGVPGITFLAPASREEMEMMMTYAVEQKFPVIIRYPKAVCLEEIYGLDAPLEEGKGVFAVNSGKSRVLIIITGGLIAEASAAVHALVLEEKFVDLYNLRFISPLDTEYLLQVISEYDSVLCVEEGVSRGGIGEEIGAMLQCRNINIRYDHFGVPGTFLPQASRSELLKLCGMDKEALAQRLRRYFLKQVAPFKKASGLIG